MDKKRYFTVKSVPLKNNCPECFSTDGLQLTFTQGFKETKLYKSITEHINYHINCDRCATDIYPERWTEDIERVVAYQKKALTPKPVSKRFKPLFWGLVIGTLLIIAVSITAVVLAK